MQKLSVVFIISGLFLVVFFVQCSEPSPEIPVNVIAGDTIQISLTFNNFEPDTVIPFIDRFDTAFFDLDFNQDGICDIQIMTYQEWGGNFSKRWSKIRNLSDSVMIALNDSVDFPAIISKNELISDSLRWKKGEFLIFYKYGAEGGISEQEGIWFNSNKNYIAIRYQKNALHKFGWICLDYQYPNLTVYDYAY